MVWSNLRRAVAVGAVALAIVWVHPPVGSAAFSTEDWYSSPAYEDYRNMPTLGSEVRRLASRGATDTCVYELEYNAAYGIVVAEDVYFCPTSYVTREQFFGMLGRAFHVTPSWSESGFSDYKPGDAGQSRSPWYSRTDRNIRQVIVQRSDGNGVGVMVLRWVEGSNVWRWEYRNAPSGQAIDMPAGAKAISIKNWGSASYVVRVIYEDGSSEVYTTSGWAYQSLPLIPRLDSYYPWVRGAITRGWAEGYDDGTFRPKNTMTRLEAMVAMVRAMGYRDFARSLRPDQVERVLSRFADYRDVPEALRPEVAALVISGVTRGRDGRLFPFDKAQRQEAAAFIDRASRVVVKPSAAIWSPDGDGVKDTLEFNIVPGYPYQIVGGPPGFKCRDRSGYNVDCKWSLNIYQFREEGSTWQVSVDSVSGLQSETDAQRNYVRAAWTPASPPPAGFYMAMGQLRLANAAYGSNLDSTDIYASSYAPFEVIYPTLSATASNSRVKSGGTVTIDAFATGRPDRVWVWVPVTGGGSQLLDLTRQEVVETDPVLGEKEHWVVTWTVPADLEGGNYTLTVVAEYPDGSTRTATVPIEIYGVTVRLEVRPGDAVRVGSPVTVYSEWCGLSNVQIDLTSLGGDVVSDSRTCASRSDTFSTPNPGIYTVCLTGRDDLGQTVKRCVTISFWNVETYLIPEEKARQPQP